ncbi:serine hydrolase [Changchengzhania lutea]|uniref:serine hydrolase n=1 Tax=Changchengzhania lutea TaxID=2049305 RepID=UPI00163DD8B7|nr:serine hydrolase [Changchengzhania lutea]
MTPIKSLKTLFLLLVTLGISYLSEAQNLEQQIDAFMASEYKANEPGASVLIARDGKTIYKKAFGQANLELNVPMTTQNVVEIGSITKQFTAVAILMLEEQGKLNINDIITKFIPDYPTMGKTVTVHHLLNHTSGIKSYTGMKDFRKMAATDMTPLELIDVFKNEPMDFDPGEDFRYNNSGYILLGYIIEVASGQTYEDFIEKEIFQKLGMYNSYYGSKKEIIEHRATGYSMADNGYVNADYLSLTLPYAAGSIMSTVDDLLIWQNAIVNNKLIKKSSLEKAIRGSELNSGKHISYGYGWFEDDVNGSNAYQHGGGIFGYTTMGIYLPEEKLYVAGLTNCNCKDISGVITKIAAMAINKPFPKKEDAVSLSEEQQQKWLGAYQFDNVVRYVTLTDGQLYSQREGSTNLEIYPMSPNTFIFENGTTSYTFSMKDGKKQALFKGSGQEVIGVEIDKAAPEPKKEITLSPDALVQYIGKFELQPGFIITVTTNDGRLFAQATGQPQFELFAEDEDTFFLKVVPASVDFNKDNEGNIESLTLHQNGQHMEGKKIE